jgi:hypothetical protein
MSTRLDLVLQKYPEHEDGIRLLASRDPSQKLKYLDWGAKMLESGQALAPEIADILDLFHRFNGQWFGPRRRARVLETPRGQIRSDIYTYRPQDLASLRDALLKMQRAQDRKRQSREQLYRIEGAVEADIVYDSADLVVRHIKNKQASIHYGHDTKWCISMKRDDYFEDYEAYNAVFFFFERKAPLGDEFDGQGAGVRGDGRHGDPPQRVRRRPCRVHQGSPATPHLHRHDPAGERARANRGDVLCSGQPSSQSPTPSSWPYYCEGAPQARRGTRPSSCSNAEAGQDVAAQARREEAGEGSCRPGEGWTQEGAGPMSAMKIPKHAGSWVKHEHTFGCDCGYTSPDSAARGQWWARHDYRGDEIAFAWTDETKAEEDARLVGDGWILSAVVLKPFMRHIPMGVQMGPDKGGVTYIPVQLWAEYGGGFALRIGTTVLCFDESGRCHTTEMKASGLPPEALRIVEMLIEKSRESAGVPPDEPYYHPGTPGYQAEVLAVAEAARIAGLEPREQDTVYRIEHELEKPS